MNCLIDGQPAAELPADDRGLMYGESVFETLAVKDRVAPLWDLHMQRMARAAQAVLGLELPPPDIWRQDCQRLLPPQGRYVLRLCLTAGSGGSGYWPAPQPRPRRVVQLRAWPDKLEAHRLSGLRLRRSSFTVVNEAGASGYKHGNRLLQVQAARECAQSGHDEAVLLDADGNMLEAISSNLLLVRQKQLLTHPMPAVRGVGLAWLASQGSVSIIENQLPYSRLDECSEVLVINSVAGIRPVIEVDQSRFPIGPMCRSLQSLWDSKLI